MIPKLKAIDHIHIYVKDRSLSESWYQTVLGLTRSSELAFWASDGGPLTLENDDNSVHLALFESDAIQNTTVAFSVSGQEYMKWFAHLKENGLEVEHSDHQVSWSLYFKDLDGNPFEITTYDYGQVKTSLI